MRALPALLVLAAVTLSSCASAPRPRVMHQVDSAREAPAAREAASLAPQAFARAEQLRQRSLRAFDAGDRSGAQILAEHALAAYSRAVILTRLVKAQSELARAKQRLTKAQAELGTLDEQLAKLSAEADVLELRVKVARDAQPLAANTPSTPERERARRDAASALASQARLLCTAAHMLDARRATLPDHFAKLDALDKQLAAKGAQTPIDDATRLRSACLRELSEVRRRAVKDGGLADALLAELSQPGNLFPFRDDRGVVITVRDLFTAAGQLKADAEERLAVLGKVAKAHPEFPVLVVFHTSRTAPGLDAGRAESVLGALRKAGATRVETRSAGSALPVVEPKRGGARERNERIEIIFVSPA
ncbi:MAG TPA: hypothetical protein VK524_32190 [Polyangiaceae bacterium]|nr:hypothetical protein [Polyangiaceae bacterium]